MTHHDPLPRGTADARLVQPSKPEPEVEAAPPAGYAGVDPHEIGVGKPIAALCYACTFLMIPFFCVPLLRRSNAFALFHAKQSLWLWVMAIAGFLICFGMIFAFGLGIFLFPLWALFVVVEVVVGIVNACHGRFRSLPLIGPNAERSLAGLHTRSSPSPA